MRINLLSGNDLILLGLCFGVAGTLILGKGYIFKSIRTIRDESASYFGANPYAIRNKIITKWEGIIGVTLILPAAIFQLFGIYLNVTRGKVDSIFLNPTHNVIFLVLLTIFLIWIANLIAGLIAKRNYIYVLRESLKEGFRQTEYVLKNDGVYEKEQNQEISREIRDQRLTDIRQKRLENWERLFCFKRKPKESDVDYFFRLKRYLDSY